MKKLEDPRISSKKLLHRPTSLEFNLIVAKIVLIRRNKSNLELQKVSTEDVLNSRRIFHFTVEV
jgi:hypothetical protein